MSVPFCSVNEWRDEFGSSSEKAFDTLVPTLFKVKNGEVYFNLNLIVFDEMFDLLDVDPDLVAETIVLSDIFADPDLDPDVLTALLSISHDKLGYSPIDAAGNFVITFDDFRKYYGETLFDNFMKETYSNTTYNKLKDLLSGISLTDD